ncbi:MAG: SpoIID/LytB domain-containing protein [Austwickia sp.]|nr:SpoIID/LytB domain-containing protein [Austwickia sp.]
MNSHPWLRRAAIRLTALVAGVVAPATFTSSAQAAEVVPRPSAGQITVTGHGYGHGRGMSQWGAYGAATKGLPYAQILGFYYPGTTRTTIGNDTIRVALSDEDGDTVVAPAAGLAVTTKAGTVTLPTGTAYTAWRVSGTGPVKLDYKDATGAWKPYSGAGTLGAEVTFTTSGGTVRVLLPSGTWEEVRGQLHAVAVSGRVRTVLHTPIETYLRGVVPNEMPASWHGQALAAQSVAARTYAQAYRQRQRAAGSWYDICDTVQCQVFAGVARYSGGTRTPQEDPRTDAAIGATAGVVLTYNGVLVNAEFSASNGGWTAAGAQPYQVAKADPYDGAVSGSPTTWTTQVNPANLDNVRGIGRFRQVVILSRTGSGDQGGRVLTARLDGDAGSADVTGEQLRSLLGLRSSWFTMTSSGGNDARDFDGDSRPDVLARGTGGDLLLFPGTGSGSSQSFGAGRRIGVGWDGMVDLFSARDFNGDGNPDIVGRLGDGRLFFYAGNGRGGWVNQYQIGNGWTHYRAFVGAGDWNRDGHPDVLAIDTATNQLVISMGTGRVLRVPVAIGTSWGAIVRLVTPGDFDGDGKDDLIGITAAGDMWLYSGDGAGRIRDQRQIGRGWDVMASVWSIGDADGDGAADLLAIHKSGDLWRYTGTGTGGFRVYSNLGGGWANRLPVA